jgi:hypothetical protein
MWIDAGRDVPVPPGERVSYVLFLVLLLGLFGAEVVVNFAPAKLSVLFFVLFWLPLVAWHELGHALMAGLFRWRVERVVIGIGRLLGTFTVAGVPVEVRLVALEGFVNCGPADGRFNRWKSALVYFAGPGIELVLAAALLVAVGPDVLFQRGDDIGLIALQSLALAATTGAVLNLVPHGIRTPHGLTPNDGLGILLSLTAPAGGPRLSAPTEDEE